MSTTPAAATAASNASVIQPKKNDRATMASNFDQFLQLLTTQLKNQSPLDPLDTNQFTQQLVQFSQVEQQLKQNETLTALLSASKAGTVSNAMNFVGARVTMDGSGAELKNGVAEWSLDAERASSATITIRDKAGNVVNTYNRTLNAGTNSFRWDGRTSTGATATDGQYQILVEAADSQRARVTVKTEVSGIVDTVDFSGETPILQIGNSRIAMDKVKSATRN
jgi:flagellar basal-body rod modification protein FlgD